MFEKLVHSFGTLTCKNEKLVCLTLPPDQREDWLDVGYWTIFCVRHS